MKNITSKVGAPRRSQSFRYQSHLHYPAETAETFQGYEGPYRKLPGKWGATAWLLSVQSWALKLDLPD